MMHKRNAKSKLHACRKFFDTQLSNSQVHPNAISKMMGHKDGLKGIYYRPETTELFDEYKKAIPRLTISEKLCKNLEIKNLENHNKELENKLKIADLEKTLIKLNNHVDDGFLKMNDILKTILDEFQNKN
jgi:hypothetical protein